MKTHPNYATSFIASSFVLVLFFVSLTIQAQTFSSVAGDIVIPNGTNAPLCTNPGAYVCKTVVVSGLPSFAILRTAAVVLIDGSGVGLVDVEVRAPAGTPTFLPFSRTGSVNPSDCGDTTDIEGDYTFLDSSVANWWTTAGGLGSTNTMPNGTYFPSFPGGGPSPPAGNPNNTMSLTFLGVTNGDWQICARNWGDNGGSKLQLARLTFSVPTAAAASISGQVLTAGGSGVRNAIVVLSGDNLPGPITTKSTSFGYYSFAGVPAGGTYVVTVQSKRYTFSNPSLVFNVQDDIVDANFVAEEK